MRGRSPMVGCGQGGGRKCSFQICLFLRDSKRDDFSLIAALLLPPALPRRRAHGRHDARHRPRVRAAPLELAPRAVALLAPHGHRGVGSMAHAAVDGLRGCRQPHQGIGNIGRAARPAPGCRPDLSRPHALVSRLQSCQVPPREGGPASEQRHAPDSPQTAPQTALRRPPRQPPDSPKATPTSQQRCLGLTRRAVQLVGTCLAQQGGRT